MSKELGMSLFAHLLAGGTLVLADEYLSPSSTSKSKEEPQTDNRTMVEITPVSLAKKADGLPDKASRKPTESAKEVPQPQQKTQSRPQTQTKPSTKTAAPTPPKAPTEPKASEDDILENLYKTVDFSVPEGQENRDATATDAGSNEESKFIRPGESTPINLWWGQQTETIWAIASRNLVPTTVASLSDDAEVLIPIQVDANGRVEIRMDIWNAERNTRSSGNRSVDEAILRSIRQQSKFAPPPMPDGQTVLNLEVAFSKRDYSP